VVKCSWFPAIGGMAGTAILAKSAFVIVILLVTGVTTTGCTLEQTVDMTTLASHRDMFSS
jgi:hypothetical protein